MKNPTLVALLTGLTLMDYAEAIIPRHVVRNPDGPAAESSFPLNTVFTIPKDTSSSVGPVPTPTNPSTTPAASSFPLNTVFTIPKDTSSSVGPAATPTNPAATPAPTGVTSSSSSVPLAFTASSLVISGSITLPPQTATETGQFSTTTLTDHTGPPGTFSATTTTNSDHHPTILPVWFNTGGSPIIVIPIGNNGPPGIIPPPPGFPPVVFDPFGNPFQAGDPVPATDPSPTPNADPTSNPTSAPQNSMSTTNPASTAPSASTQGTSQVSSTEQSSSTSSSSTSTAATGAPTPMLVFPIDTASPGDKVQFQSQLAAEVGGEKNLQTVTDPITGPFVWLAPLNSTQVAKFQGNPIVKAIFPNSNLEFDELEDPPLDAGDVTGDATANHAASPAKIARRAITSQANAPPDLAIVSQPQGQPLPADYQFDDSAAAGITIFVLDTGVNQAHVEFTGLPGNKQVIDLSGGNGADDLNHGSCVLSMAASPTLGVAKNANIVFVKMNFVILPNGKSIVTFLDFIRAVQVVIQQVEANNAALRGKAVVNVSLAFRGRPKQETDTARPLIAKLKALDIPIVAAAGNRATPKSPLAVDGFPALYENDIPDSIIVVGATDNDGVLAPFSQGGPLVTIFAPGFTVKCMSNTGTTGTVERAGTSYAAPKVAGLAAYFMGLPNANFQAGQVSAQVKAQINSLAFSRTNPATVNVLSNIIPCVGPTTKRDVGNFCSLSPSPSGATALSLSSIITLSTVTGSPPPSTTPSIIPTSSASSTIPPLPSSVGKTITPPVETLNPNDPNCTTCQDHLGASNCKPEDNKCLLQQCLNDDSCTRCNIDCSTFIAPFELD